MKKVLLAAALVAAALAAGCNHYLPVDVSLSPTLEAAPDRGPDLTMARLVGALEALGHTPRLQGAVQQPFLSVTGQRLALHGSGIQVYEYEDGVSARMESLLVSPDARTAFLGDAHREIHWIDAPHFYQRDRLIVVYVGQDERLLDALETTLGEPYAVGAPNLRHVAL